MSKRRSSNTQRIDLRPISTICRRHATASHQIGYFHMSTGYEIVRLVIADTVEVRWHPEHQGSSFNAPVREDSVTHGLEVLANIARDLAAAGFAVNTDTGDDLSIRIRVEQ